MNDRPALDLDGAAALLGPLTDLVAKAGAAILAVNRVAMSVDGKPDGSPVTEADLAADRVIAEGLARLFPDIPTLSEERLHLACPPYAGSLFLIDPLDGTKEFVAGRKEFTVNIALVVGGVPLLGIVGAPDLGLIWRGLVGRGAERLELADDLTPEAVREMHRVLMSATNHTPGEWRSEPVWIGADARSPVGATYVAPRHEYVPALMDDVMAFAARQDLPVLAQVAIAHAQFETIHPFTDGNGRTGRALVQSMLRAKGLTRDVVVPISAGLLVDVAAYHDALTSYRAGDVEPIVEQFARAAVDAIINARQLVDALRVVRQSWSEILNARSGSQLAKLLPFVVQRPVFTASEAAAYLDIAPSNAYPLIKRLVALGIAQQKSEHGLGVVVYRSDDVLNLLDQFAERAGRRSV